MPMPTIQPEDSTAIFDDSKPIMRHYWLAPFAAIAVLEATLGFLATSFQGNREHAKETLLVLAAAWAIGAPVWFFTEYHVFYRNAPAPKSFDLFKHGQQLAIAIWAGIAAALYAASTSDFAKPKNEPVECIALKSASAEGLTQPPAVTFVKCPK